MRNNKIVFALVLMFGIATINYGTALAGGTVCLDAVGCNDIKLAWNETGDPSVFELNGWEYGCNLLDRLVYGTARLEGNAIYFNFTKGVMISGQAGETHYNAVLTSGSGPASGFAQRLTGDFSISDTFTFISCPVVEELPEGIDAEVQ